MDNGAKQIFLSVYWWANSALCLLCGSDNAPFAAIAQIAIATLQIAITLGKMAAAKPYRSGVRSGGLQTILQHEPRGLPRL